MTDKQAETVEHKGDTLGKLLRSQREQQQLSIDDIANRIHLAYKIIAEIEADDYSNISSATYARGYLRSYAKCIGADANHIVSLYNADNEAPPPGILPEVKPPSQVSSSDKPVKAFTYLITLGLFLLILIWYQSNYIVGVESNTNATEAAEPETVNNSNAEFDVVIHPEGWQSPKSDEGENDTDKMTQPILKTANNATTQLLITKQIESLDPTDELTGPEAIDSTESNTAIVTNSNDAIRFVFNQDCWLEVYDANGERLFMNLAKQGEQIDITGTAPFDLIIGYSPGVAITFNDEPIDPEPYSNNGIARFQLPIE